jgi:hypothetical protein
MIYRKLRTLTFFNVGRANQPKSKLFILIQSPHMASGRKSHHLKFAITRARLKWSQAIRFWRSIPPVVSDLHQSPGLIFSIGIGEAPIGLQGTFSVWRSAGALRDFAYKNAPHRAAIADTQRFAWYSEELFARFELINTADFDYVN